MPGAMVKNQSGPGSAMFLRASVKLELSFYKVFFVGKLGYGFPKEN